MMLKEVERLWHKQFGRTLPLEALARSGVELPSDGIEFGLGESRQVGALGEILPEQAVGVLVDAALPRAVRIGEVDIDPGHFREPFVLRHLAPLIVSQGESTLRIDAVKDGSETGDSGVSGCVVHFCQGHEQRGSFHQGADGRRVASPFDQITLPVSGNDALGDFRGAHMDADHVGNGTPAIFAPAPGMRLLRAWRRPAINSVRNSPRGMA